MRRQVNVSDSVFLRKSGAGDVLLCIGAIEYGPTDWLPRAYFEIHEIRSGKNAAEFVQAIFTRKLGPDRTAWPELAARFVIDA